MAVEILAPLGAFMMLTLVSAFITRLIATGMLNRTIREALRTDPGSVPLLAAKLEARQPWADALLGWLFLTLAAILAAFALFEEGHGQRELLRAAAVPLILGLVTLAYVHFAGKQAAKP